MTNHASGYQPDLLLEGLDVIFCGINPAMTAAISGKNFSHQSNRFWKALHQAGFTDTLLAAKDEHRLLTYHCGLSAAVQRPTRRASEVTTKEFQRARPHFEAKIERYAPRTVAFLGKPAYAAMFGHPTVRWGQQPEPIANAKVWVLPNPSGLNRAFTLEALVEKYAELHCALRRLK